MLIEDEGVKQDTDATPAPETQSEKTEGSSSPEASAPATAGGETTGGKTYTEEEVNRIMHERTKDFAQMKRDLEAYKALGTAQDVYARLNPPKAPVAPQAPAELDEDDKKFMAYLNKLYPGMNKLGILDKFDDKRVGFIEALQKRDEAEQTKFVETSEGDVFKFCDSIGAKDESQRVVVRDAVAAAILNDANLMAKWERRDPSVISDAIKVLESTLGKRTEIASKQDLSAAKAKTEKVQAPLPKGGIPAPISKERKLGDDERVDKAWDALHGKG